MSNPIIEVRNLSKKYRLGEVGFGTLRDEINTAWHRLRTGKAPEDARRPEKGEFWALRDVSFEVQPGQIVGVIGGNGAGKSTLLKILSRITEPTKGEAILRGRVASLLEVGTGFNPELTGRENIYLNGAILGMKRFEITAKLKEIIDFAEITKHIDTPVKRYSSGMYVRLAFAVAAHLEPEILVVDEVLAVGDVAFQKKCLGKMKDVSTKDGRTVLFVSHNMTALQALCNAACYLQAGTVKAYGDVNSLVDQYLNDIAPARVNGQIELQAGIECAGLTFNPNPLVSGGPLSFQLTLRARKPVDITDLSLLIYTTQGIRIAIVDLRSSGLPIKLGTDQKCNVSGKINRLSLVEDIYNMGLFITANGVATNTFDVAAFTVAPVPLANDHVPYHSIHRGILELDFEASISPCSEAL